MAKFNVGDGVVYPTMSGKRHGTIVEVINPPNTCPGLLIDFQDYDRMAGKNPDRIWIMRGDVERAEAWSDAPKLRPFNCTNKGCYFHGNYHQQNKQTALPHCPQCGSPIEFS